MTYLVLKSTIALAAKSDYTLDLKDLLCFQPSFVNVNSNLNALVVSLMREDRVFRLVSPYFAHLGRTITREGHIVSRQTEYYSF